MVYLTFTYEFNAIHRLWSDALSDADNGKFFGECANEAGHGHLYRVEITARAPVNDNHPVVLSRTEIQRLTAEVLAPRLRHANLNEAFGKPGFVSTGENVVREIWRLVESEVNKSAELYAVHLIETAKNSFVYYGENPAHDALPG